MQKETINEQRGLMEQLKELTDRVAPLIMPREGMEYYLKQLPFLGAYYESSLFQMEMDSKINYCDFNRKINRYLGIYDKTAHSRIFPKLRARAIANKAVNYCKRNWPCGMALVKGKEGTTRRAYISLLKKNQAT